MNLQEFEKLFSTEKQCLDYLYTIRWENGFICPRCQHNEMWVVSDHKYKCKKCQYQTTVISGTLFHDTHIPLTLWFKAMWLITHKDKITTTELQKELGLGSNRTSLRMMNKIKSAKYSSKHNKLQGIVEIECKYMKILNKWVRLIFAVEINDKTIGQIKIAEIKNNTTEQLNKFVENNIERGSTIVSKKWAGFDNLINNGYTHQSKASTYSFPYVNKVHLKFAGWISKSFTKEIPADYIDCYCSIFNTGKAKITFEELLDNAVHLRLTP